MSCLIVVIVRKDLRHRKRELEICFVINLLFIIQLFYFVTSSSSRGS